MIEHAVWDSEFFGYPVGTCRISTDKPLDELAFRKAAEPFRLVYMLSNDELPIKFARLVDRKVVLGKSIKNTTNTTEVQPYDAAKHSYAQLLELAYLSGNYSRFRIDQSFQNNEFERMYKIWLDNSISGKIAQYVLVATAHNELTGFITVQIKPDKKAHIGLVAVSAHHQGKGIGGKLLAAADYYAHQAGCQSIEVPTQYDNEPAMRLYQKHGYHIQTITFIYHFWNI
jgi:dTDP-4-amino-4,6-dideoxy-D-galactose acyltransferase